MLDIRGCGVLLHPTSLPGVGGIGTFGQNAERFIDMLCEMGMSYWQVLPLTPPSCGNSPYSSFSAFAGNSLLIDIEQLVSDGDLPLLHFDEEKTADNLVDFDAVYIKKESILRVAASNFLKNDSSRNKQEFWDFCNNTQWLHYYALFMALKNHFKGQTWNKWPVDFALITLEKYEEASIDFEIEIGIQKYIQWQFFRQWKRLRKYAADKRVAIIGDIPIFVGYDSADVWSHRELFLLDEEGKSTAVAGVPPDYFSTTGQLWGNPLYNWEVIVEQKFSWWIDRFTAMFNLFDVVRVDHFRGFEAAWHVDAGEKTAVNGKWVKAPGTLLFNTLQAHFGDLPIIAEDLGIITSEVTKLRERYGFPGMKIEQFAFDSGSSNPYLPHNHEKKSVIYTGTHDNDTTYGWYESLSDAQQKHISNYVGSNQREAVDGVIRTVLMSVANTAILPFQDLLHLGSDARMNIPGTAYGNWGWRFKWDMIPSDLVKNIRNQVELYGRFKRL